MGTRYQKGFSAVEVIIVVAVVLVVGLGGWLLWHNKQAAKPAAKQSGSSAASKTTAGSSSNGQGGDTKYLKIPEWGIEFSLRAENADAYYDTKTSSPLESRSLRSHSLDSEPDCTTGSQSVATIFRVPKDAKNEDGQPDKMYRETQDGQVIGNYFYFIAGAQYSCTQDTDMQVVLQAVRNSFVTAGPTIQKILP